MQVTPSKQFEKRYRKLPPKIKARVRERIALFELDPSNPVLENHPLTGKYAGCRSINITGDFRLIYRLIAPDIAQLLLIGTHHELYGS